MSHITQLEFSKKTGVKYGTLRQHVKRGKIPVTPENKINLKDKRVVEYMKDAARKAGKSPEQLRKEKEQEKLKAEKIKAKQKLDAQKAADEQADQDIEDAKKSFDEVETIEDLRKEKIRAEVKLLNIKEQKQRAELIPTEKVKPLFMQFSKFMTTAYHNELNTIMLEIAHKTKLSKKDQAYFKKRVIEVVNKANDDAVEDTKRNIKHIADEFSEIKQRGERN